MHTDLIMTFIAALLYFIQPLVNAMHYPKEERRTYYVMMVLSPLFLCITTICFSLKFILMISATFLIIQMHFAHSHYAKVGKAAGEQLKRQIEQQRQNKTNDDKA